MIITNKTIEKENNRVPMKLDNVYIVKNVEIPLTIVECGFLSNEEEETCGRTATPSLRTTAGESKEPRK